MLVRATFALPLPEYLIGVGYGQPIFFQSLLSTSQLMLHRHVYPVTSTPQLMLRCPVSMHCHAILNVKYIALLVQLNAFSRVTWQFVQSIHLPFCDEVFPCQVEHHNDYRMGRARDLGPASKKKTHTLVLRHMYMYF